MARVALMVCVLAVGCASTARRHQVHVVRGDDGRPAWEVETDHGVPHGRSVTYHPNGRVASEGTYEHGRREGRFTYYDERGEVARVDVYHHDRLVEHRGHRRRPPSAIATRVTPRVVDDRPLAGAIDVSMGMGASGSARELGDGEGLEPVLAASALLRFYTPHVVLGVSAETGGVPLEYDESYIGPVVGVKTGRDLRLELLAEIGLHRVTDLGNELFMVARSANTAELPYVGARAGGVVDFGNPGGFTAGLWVIGRRDLGRDRIDVSTETCFFGCTQSVRSYEVGGASVMVQGGVGYAF